MWAMSVQKNGRASTSEKTRKGFFLHTRAGRARNSRWLAFDSSLNRGRARLSLAQPLLPARLAGALRAVWMQTDLTVAALLF